VFNLNGFLTEIRTFYSLKEIREKIEEETNQYKLLLEDYSQWLGSLLRNPESSKNQEWAKKTAELQKVLRVGSRKSNKKEEKKAGASTEWVQFKEITISADDFGEVEILFEAIEELKNKIARLEKTKNSLIDLERYGLGKELLYIAYVHDGVPEKIVFKPKKGFETKEKFEFTADFSIAEQT
jgi:hypothetical protein